MDVVPPRDQKLKDLSGMIIMYEDDPFLDLETDMEQEDDDDGHVEVAPVAMWRT